MDRVRRAGQIALFLVIAMSAATVGSVRPASPATAERLAAAVSWPTSTLLVSEVMTGGASASDEFAEITNAGSVAIDLTGHELVYVTSSGGTVTRKAAWTTPTILEPGRHLLVANVLGIHAGIADATYSGGFAATGGVAADADRRVGQVVAGRRSSPIHRPSSRDARGLHVAFTASSLSLHGRSLANTAQ